MMLSQAVVRTDLFPEKQTESRGGTDTVRSRQPRTHLGRLRRCWGEGPTNSRHCGNHRGDHLDRMMLSQAVVRTDLFPEKQTESRGGTDTVRSRQPGTHLGRLRRCWGGGSTNSRHCGNHRGDHLDRMMLSQAVVRADLFPEKQTESRGGTDTVRSRKPRTHLGRLRGRWGAGPSNNRRCGDHSGSTLDWQAGVARCSRSTVADKVFDNWNAGRHA
ncbi:Aste57867_4329 [Aphanomyces stellatus]|uniref:Aste57867_4329 protein n=1 Tax=Aphanomyces stellatus TaxID=120398 RepID=A0A485KCF7_9STRA|nr:hypothetical protein As57867_004318 [Aphanomyces stellatus]VFT81443.1 Aste57867_4329 [Aphanomyces stellatus]